MSFGSFSDDDWLVFFVHGDACLRPPYCSRCGDVPLYCPVQYRRLLSRARALCADPGDRVRLRYRLRSYAVDLQHLLRYGQSSHYWHGSFCLRADSDDLRVLLLRLLVLLDRLDDDYDFGRPSDSDSSDDDSGDSDSSDDDDDFGRPSDDAGSPVGCYASW